MNVERLVDYPTLSDVEVVNLLAGLRKVCKAHQQILEKTGKSMPYYPDEIVKYLNFSILSESWRRMDYETIREDYVRAWMKHVETIAGDPPFFTLEEFLNGTAAAELME